MRFRSVVEGGDVVAWDRAPHQGSSRAATEGAGRHPHTAAAGADRDAAAEPPHGVLRHGRLGPSGVCASRPLCSTSLCAPCSFTPPQRSQRFHHNAPEGFSIAKHAHSLKEVNLPSGFLTPLAHPAGCGWSGSSSGCSPPPLPRDRTRTAPRIRSGS